MCEAQSPEASCTSGLGGAVADARLGFDGERHRRIDLYLGPELSDENPEVLRVLGMRRPPDRGQNLPMAHHSARVAKEDRKQVIFFRRQLDWRPVAADEAPVEVHRGALH